MHCLRHESQYKTKSVSIFIIRYVSKNSKGDLRKCCLTKTYDPRQLACCQHHELKAVGTCFEPCEANPNGIHCRSGNRP